MNEIELRKIFDDILSKKTIIDDFHKGNLGGQSLNESLFDMFKEGFNVSKSINDLNVYCIEYEECNGCDGWSGYSIIPSTITTDKNKIYERLKCFNDSKNRWERYRITVLNIK